MMNRKNKMKGKGERGDLACCEANSITHHSTVLSVTAWNLEELYLNSDINKLHLK